MKHRVITLASLTFSVLPTKRERNKKEEVGVPLLLKYQYFDYEVTCHGLIRYFLFFYPHEMLMQ